MKVILNTEATGNGTINGGTPKYGSKQVTGFSEYWKANNIYDLAGNCYEWSQEACYASNRADRGGACGYDGSNDPASKHGNCYASNDYSDLRFSSHFNNKVDGESINLSVINN